MAPTPQHTYQVLTKRPERLERMFNRTGLDGRCPAPGLAPPGRLLVREVARMKPARYTPG
jgi:hypothetical protein